MSNAKNANNTIQSDESKAFSERFLKIVGGTATQDEIAKTIGTSRQNVGNWISGKAKPDIYALAKISKAYQVSTDYLLGLTDIQTKNGDVSAFCGVSGISENAALHLLFNQHADIFNKMIECFVFDDFLSVLHYLTEQSEYWIEQAKQNDNISKLDLDYVDLYRYRAHKIFDIILNEFDQRTYQEELTKEINSKTKEHDIELQKQLDRLTYEYYAATSEDEKTALANKIQELRNR